MSASRRTGMLALAVALSLAGPALAAADHETIRPGYWESRNKASFPINDETTTRQCITPEKVAQFLSGPSTKHFHCIYSRSQVANGKVSAQGECVDKNGLHSTIEVKGDYTPTRFKLNAKVTVNLGGLPIPVNASTDATFLADACPLETH